MRDERSLTEGINDKKTSQGHPHENEGSPEGSDDGSDDPFAVNYLSLSCQGFSLIKESADVGRRAY